MPPEGNTAASRRTARRRAAPPAPDKRKCEESQDAEQGGLASPAKEESAPANASPLEYMLGVMRDPAVDPARRDEMAKLALPYLHPKPTAIEHTGRDGGPIEIADVSETDIARRIGFMLARAAQY